MSAEDKKSGVEEAVGNIQQLSAAQLSEIQNLLLRGAPLGAAAEEKSGAVKPTPTYSTFSDLTVEVGQTCPLITCPRCPSKICLSGAATFTSVEMKMGRYRVDGPEEEVLSKFWLLTSLMAFENIGVSHMVDKVKFLSCADCEVGPIGWHNITDNTKYYIAAERVRYVE